MLIEKRSTLYFNNRPNRILRNKTYRNEIYSNTALFITIRHFLPFSIKFDQKIWMKSFFSLQIASCSNKK